jgi:HSP20 family protein
MSLYSYNPSSRFMRRMLETMFNDQNYNSESYDVFVPVDVKAEADSYVITAIVPGIQAEGVNIRIVNTTVSIEGELPSGRDEKGSYLLSERPSGKFHRMLTLPDQLNAAKTEASLTDGVLTLRVAKAEEAQPKMIKVISK